jgi:hypothetical protein
MERSYHLQHRETGCTIVGGPNLCEFIAMDTQRKNKVCIYCGLSPQQVAETQPRSTITINVTKEEQEALQLLMPNLFRNL